MLYCKRCGSVYNEWMNKTEAIQWQEIDKCPHCETCTKCDRGEYK